MTTPPPIPSQVPNSFYHHSATAGLLATPLALGITLISKIATMHMDPKIQTTAGIISGCFAALILLLGLISAIIALCGIPKYGRKKILIKGIVGVILPLILVFLCAIPVMVKMAKAANTLTSVDTQLMIAVREINRTKDKSSSDETRLDGAESLGNRTMAYNYSLLKQSKSPELEAAFKTTVHDSLVKTYKTDPDLKFFRDNGVTIIYRYKDKAGELVGEITTGPSDL